jgi:thioredoxin-related protein
MRSLLLVLAISLYNLSLQAQPAGNIVPSANDIMKQALAQAGKEHKNVLIMFHASWCGWCHRMDSSLNDPVCKKFFDDNFVITHLVVDESKDKQNLENPGANEMRTKYHGDGVGIPFWLIFDKDGKLLADSKIRKNGESEAAGNNIGCPANEDEVAYFVELLKKSTRLNADQLDIIAKRFRKNAL